MDGWIAFELPFTFWPRFAKSKALVLIAAQLDAEDLFQESRVLFQGGNLPPSSMRSQITSQSLRHDVACVTHIRTHY